MSRQAWRVSVPTCTSKKVPHQHTVCGTQRSRSFPPTRVLPTHEQPRVACALRRQRALHACGRTADALWPAASRKPRNLLLSVRSKKWNQATGRGAPACSTERHAFGRVIATVMCFNAWLKACGAELSAVSSPSPVWKMAWTGHAPAICYSRVLVLESAHVPHTTWLLRLQQSAMLVPRRWAPGKRQLQSKEVLSL